MDGSPAALSAILLTDDSGNGYTYYKLRDLGEALNFQVDWTAGRGTCIDTQVRYLQALQTDREEVLRLVNAARAEEGLSPLQLHEDLCAAAQLRAEELRVQFSHTRPNGEGCGTVYEEFGITPNRSGENIASGYSNPAEVTEGWLNSPGHRMNIMIPNIQYLGVGRVDNSWVQLFLGL